MIVIKIGGSLLTDSSGIEEVVNYLIANRGKKPVVVVSAFKGITDLLIETARFAKERDVSSVKKNLKRLRERHLNIVKSLINDGDRLQSTSDTIAQLFNEVKGALNDVLSWGRLRDEELDRVMSYGEKLSSVIISSILEARGVPSVAVFSERLIITDQNFGNASPIHFLTEKRIKEFLPQWQDKIPIITGFIGSTEDGKTTTLGRGGSDYSAAIIAYYLNAKEVWLVKDTEGVMTANPDVVPDARIIPELSYEEAAELSYSGAKVIHPRTVEPLKMRKIPLRIKYLKRIDHPGTLVKKWTERKGTIKSIVHRSDLALIEVQGNGTIGVSSAITTRVFAVASERGLDILMASQLVERNAVLFVIPKPYSEGLFNAVKEEFGEEMLSGEVNVSLKNGISALSVVGRGVSSDPEICGKIEKLLEENGIKVIASTNVRSDIVRSFIVQSDDLSGALNLIHREFNLGRG